MNFKTTDYKLILLPLSIILISVVLLYFSIISTKIICSDCKFEVKKNESAYQIAYRLVDMDIINEPYSFKKLHCCKDA